MKTGAAPGIEALPPLIQVVVIPERARPGLTAPGAGEVRAGPGKGFVHLFGDSARLAAQRRLSMEAANKRQVVPAGPHGFPAIVAFDPGQGLAEVNP